MLVTMVGALARAARGAWRGEAASNARSAACAKFEMFIKIATNARNARNA